MVRGIAYGRYVCRACGFVVEITRSFWLESGEDTFSAFSRQQRCGRCNAVVVVTRMIS